MTKQKQIFDFKCTDCGATFNHSPMNFSGYTSENLCSKCYEVRIDDESLYAANRTVTEITPTDFMYVIAREIAHGLASASPDAQISAKERFEMHAGALSASEYTEFADAVRMYAAIERIKGGQS